MVGARLFHLLAGLLVTVAALFAATGAASAHASLLRSTPAEQAVVRDAPAQVVLTFSEPVTPLVAKLLRPDGTTANLVASVSGADVRIALSANDMAAQGTYLLSWRVVSADGHPVGGNLTFSLGHAERHGARRARTDRPATANRPLGHEAGALSRPVPRRRRCLRAGLAGARQPPGRRHRRGLRRAWPGRSAALLRPARARRTGRAARPAWPGDGVEDGSRDQLRLNGRTRLYRAGAGAPRSGGREKHGALAVARRARRGGRRSRRQWSRQCRRARNG